jgi:hypothetical protein
MTPLSRYGVPSESHFLLFARIRLRPDGYHVTTNDWRATDLRAQTFDEAKTMVEAMWALED